MTLGERAGLSTAEAKWYARGMKETSDKTRLAELAAEQADSVDPKYLEWVEEKIAEGREQMKDQSKRIPAEAVWEAFDLEH